MRIHERTEEEKIMFGDPIPDSIAVDAASSGNPGRMEYRGVDTMSGAELFRQGPFEDATVNIGEFLAIVHALAYLKERDFAFPVYSDSRTAIKWTKDKRIKTKLEKTSQNKKLFELIRRAEVWLAKNDYPNKILKWETRVWGEIPADFGRK
jgi:ribonuclease HI